VTGPLPDHVTQAQPTTTHHLKGSNHDRNDHRDAKDGRLTGDGGTNGDGSSDGHRADSPDGGDQPDADRPGRTRQGTAVRRPQRVADGSESDKLDAPSVTLTAAPDGALWVAVDGADLHEVAARINATCDALLRAQPPRE
jgi:hypothetical protein